MGPGDNAKLLQPLQSDKRHETLEVIFVSPAGFGVVEVGELLGR
jgi:hypothetical protein